jgi:hypothetical protein
MVDLVVEFGVQVELQRRHAALGGHRAVQVADADPAHAQPGREQLGHRALARAQVTVDNDGASEGAGYQSAGGRLRNSRSGTAPASA